MLEAVGDLWEAHALGHWVAITTNGITRRDGHAVMGRGVAKQAAERFPAFPEAFGSRLRDHGNHVHLFSRERIITFPVKYHWRDPADLKLIRQSAQELQERFPFWKVPCYLVRPGCGNGRLSWDQVRPVIAPILDNRFIVVNRE